MEETIDLREYFYIIKKRAWIIALISIVAMVVSGVISFFVLSPVYESSTTLIVSRDESITDTGSTALTGDQITVAQKLAVTYGEIIKSRAVIDEVANNLKLDMTYDELSSAISVSSVKDTQIIKVSVQDTNPNKASDIANAIPKAFSSEVKRIMKANGVEVIDKAVTPSGAIKPNKVMNVAIAAVLGVMIGLFVVFLLEYMDTKMKTPQDIEKHLGIPLLGVVPMDKN